MLFCFLQTDEWKVANYLNWTNWKLKLWVIKLIGAYLEARLKMSVLFVASLYQLQVDLTEKKAVDKLKKLTIILLKYIIQQKFNSFVIA